MFMTCIHAYPQYIRNCDNLASRWSCKDIAEILLSQYCSGYILKRLRNVSAIFQPPTCTWYGLVLCERCVLYLLNRGKTPSCHGCFQLCEQEKVAEGHVRGIRGFFAKKLRTNNFVWLSVLSACNIYDWLFHNSGLFFVSLQDNISYWSYDFLSRTHNARTIAIEKKQWAKLSHMTAFSVLLSVLALLTVSVGKIGLWSPPHNHIPISRHHLWFNKSASALTSFNGS